MSKVVINSVINRTRTFNIKTDSKEFQNLWKEHISQEFYDPESGSHNSKFEDWDEHDKQNCWNEFIDELINGDIVPIEDESNNPYYTMEVDEDCDWSETDYPPLDS